ncbi:hypothetical protein ACP4OV_014947 [Aristida adscensionis]
MHGHGDGQGERRREDRQQGRAGGSGGAPAATAAGGKNLVFSPLSIHVALALMSTAVAGDTLGEILGFVGAPSRDELAAFVRSTVVDRVLADRSGVGGPTFSFACGAWTDRRWPLRPAYVDAVVGTFKGNTWAVDFLDEPMESRKQINAWVAEATRNLIREVLDPTDTNPFTVHVVANAIYFKGEWLNPFKEEHTDDGEFRRLDGSSVEVPFLRSWAYQYIACHEGFKVLKLPYEVLENFNFKLYHSQPRFSMCVFLPDDDDGLPSLVEKIASSPEFLHDHLPRKMVPVGKFRLQKFKLAFESDIAPALKRLGLRVPFDRVKANMSDMLLEEELRGVYVNRVVHKAVIEMNEEGSEAAAVTVESDDDMGYSPFSDDDYVAPPPPVNFVADHPFVFFIVEETSGAVVFAGHVLDPSKEE